eukprot:comp11580_c0_seq1/m.6053 comp11580_c0_seq1/g.6053  ORF comp11580_c0_seq1/g.6053 comp11580_c0_seq1/m.6053 type:complete len:457 (-) comp11580_c0_seq1:1025-2395(-)
MAVRSFQEILSEGCASPASGVGEDGRQRSNFLTVPKKGILVARWANPQRNQAERRKRVIFADESEPSKTPLDSVCLFDKDDDTLACNPRFNGHRVISPDGNTPETPCSPREEQIERYSFENGSIPEQGDQVDTAMVSERQKENQIVWSWADGAGGVYAPHGGDHIQASDPSRNLYRAAEDLCRKMRTHSSPFSHHQQHQMALVSIKHDVGKQNGTANEQALRRSRLRKVRTLWLTFTLRTEYETEDWGVVALASVQFVDRASQLQGRVRVRNTSFEKAVFIRYTVDNWRTHRDISAQYESSDSSREYDEFLFVIPVPINITHGRKIAFAVCYCADGREFWDNNHGANYEGRIVFGVPSPTADQRRPESKLVRSLEETMDEVAKQNAAMADGNGSVNGTGIGVSSGSPRMNGSGGGMMGNANGKKGVAPLAYAGGDWAQGRNGFVRSQAQPQALHMH